MSVTRPIIQSYEFYKIYKINDKNLSTDTESRDFSICIMRFQ